MQIKAISIYLGLIPLNTTFSTSLESRYHQKHICRIESDNGLIGWGEMLSLPSCGNEETAMVVGKMLAENLIDSDSTDL